MDIVKILGLGLSGLTFLLFAFSFRLISQEQKRAGQPRKGILQMILVFMLLTFISTIVVGWFGIVQSTNQQLISTNDSLYRQNIELLNTYTNYINAQTKKQIDSLISNDKQELMKQVSAIQANTDSLYQAISTADPQKADSLKQNKIKIDSIVIAIRQTPRADTQQLRALREKLIIHTRAFQKTSSSPMNLQILKGADKERLRKNP
jgi:hypothetical protein